MAQSVFVSSAKMLIGGAVAGLIVDGVVSPVLDGAISGIQNQSLLSVAKMGTSVVDMSLIFVLHNRYTEMVDVYGVEGSAAFLLGAIVTARKTQARFLGGVQMAQNRILGMIGAGPLIASPLGAPTAAEVDPYSTKANPTRQGNYEHVLSTPKNYQGGTASNWGVPIPGHLQSQLMGA